jgi:sulfur carrier protein ThiS
VKVQLKLFATLTKRLSPMFIEQYPQGLRAGSPVNIELPDNSSIADLLKRLGIDKETSLIIFVNGRDRNRDYLLVTGDQVGIFPPIGGG